MYFVYELVDPRTNVASYVGITNNPNQRYAEHMEGRVGRGKKYNWIKSLQEEETQPKMKILEVVDDAKQAKQQERHWIQHYISNGVQLTNAILIRNTPTKRNSRTEAKKNKASPTPMRQRRQSMPKHPTLGTHYLTESQAMRMQGLPHDHELFHRCREIRNIQCIPIGKSVKVDGVKYVATVEPLYSYKDMRAWRDEGDSY
jgi:predicted GIY-YIG superfamily endonuclease